MTAAPQLPALGSVQTGTPPREWSESILASNPPTDTPAVSSRLSRNEDCPDVTKGGSGEESQILQELRKQPGEESQPPFLGATATQPAKRYVPGQGIKVAVRSPSKGNKEEPHFSLPSSELKGAQPSEHSGGVGALPGNFSESSVALLPDEREERAREQRPASPRQRRDTIKLSTAGGSDEQSDVQSTQEKMATMDVGESRENKKDEESSVFANQRKDQPQEEGGKEEQTTSIRKVEQGYGGEYHPAQLHPPPPGMSVAEYQASVEAPQQVEDLPATSTGKRSSVDFEKKPGFMSVVKGEMKILAGKVSRDEQKVEEGKRLVHGEA